MTLIEGFGDEVTITLSIFVILVTVVAAWLSTRVSATPFSGSQLGGLHVRINQIRLHNQTASQAEAIRDDLSSTSPTILDVPLVEHGTDSMPAGNPGPQETSENLTQNVGRDPDSIDNELAETQNEPQLSSSSAIKDNRDTSPVYHESEPSSQTSCDSQNTSIANESTSGLRLRTHLRKNTSSTSDTSNEQEERSQSTSETVDSIPTTSQGGTGSEPASSSRLSQRLQLKVKFLNETERLVQAFPEDTVGDFKRRNFSNEAQEGKTVHLIFNGQFLREESRTLASYSIIQGCVLHCHISQNQQGPQQTSHQQEQGDLDLGQFMVPLFACTLGFVWYLRWQYHYMFNTMSTMSLVAVSVLFVLAVLAAWRS